MKTLSLLSILIFSQSIFANSLTSFFKSEQADFLCKKAKLEEGNTAKTLIKEIEASDNFVIVGFSDRNDAVISINNLAGEEIVGAKQNRIILPFQSGVLRQTQRFAKRLPL